MRPSNRTATLCASLSALALLSSCASHDSGDAPSTTSAVATTNTTTVALLAPPIAPQTKNWFDLKVGDCLTEIPAIDVGVVTATLVDCATPHQAEVYLLAPLAVNTAVDAVANESARRDSWPTPGSPSTAAHTW